MTFQAPAWAMKQRVGHTASQALLMALANHADQDGECFPSQQLLADITGQSVRTVGRQLRYLESLGLFERRAHYDSRGKRGSDRFLLSLGAVVDVDREDPRRSLLRGVDYTTRVTSLQDTGDTHYRTRVTPLSDTTVRVTPTRTPRENSQMNSHSPSGGRTTDLHRYFVRRLVESVDQYDSPFDGSLQPRGPVCGGFKRLLASGLGAHEIRWMIDRYVKKPVDWYGDTRWMDFFNRRTQERLREQLGNSRMLRLVTEAVTEVGA